VWRLRRAVHIEKVARGHKELLLWDASHRWGVDAVKSKMRAVHHMAIGSKLEREWGNSERPDEVSVPVRSMTVFELLAHRKDMGAMNAFLALG
jgi:hypothetical protein